MPELTCILPFVFSVAPLRNAELDQRILFRSSVSLMASDEVADTWVRNPLLVRFLSITPLLPVVLSGEIAPKSEIKKLKIRKRTNFGGFFCRQKWKKKYQSPDSNTWFSLCSQKYRMMIKDSFINFWFIARFGYIFVRTITTLAFKKFIKKTLHVISFSIHLNLATCKPKSATDQRQPIRRRFLVEEWKSSQLGPSLVSPWVAQATLSVDKSRSRGVDKLPPTARISGRQFISGPTSYVTYVPPTKLNS